MTEKWSNNIPKTKLWKVNLFVVSTGRSQEQKNTSLSINSSHTAIHT